jgi:hypothetical protein
MPGDLWQAVTYGKQRRTKTRSQKATQEEAAQARRESNCDADRLQTSRAEALIIGFSLTPPRLSTFFDRFRTLDLSASHVHSCLGKCGLLN